MPMIDAHCHIWALGRGDYDWLDVSDPALTPIAQDFGPTDLSQRMQAAGVGQAIVVQAAPTRAETDWLLAQAAGSAQSAGVVGWADLTRPDIAASLEAMAVNPALRGIRPMLQDLPQTDWLLEAPHPDWVAAMQSSGLRFDALVRPQHLDMLLRFCARHPDLPVVIDHAAKPVLSAAPDDPRHTLWRDGMARLGHETGAYCKLSGLLTEMATEQLPQARAILLPLMDQLLEWFGADRLMWGSDWPVLRLAGTHAGWCALVQEWLVGKPPTVRDQIGSATAARFYGLAPAKDRCSA